MMEERGSIECTVKLEIFEGPLDLLLHLIRKNEIDIYDIPMALITQQYLEYLGWMRSLNLDVASDYLLMAATLVHIKSKMILPDPVEADDEEDAAGAEDPRTELVKRLLEYKRYKEAAEQLAERDLLERDVFVRGEEASGEGEDLEGFPLLQEADLFVLIEAFQRLMQARQYADRDLQVDLDRLSLVDRIEQIAVALQQRQEGLWFEEIFSPTFTRRELIITFLALLEMIRLRMVRAYQASAYGTIRILQAAGE